MGNRAIITSTKKDLAVYVHWNGGRDSVEAFLTYCKLRGFRAPETDDYRIRTPHSSDSEFHGRKRPLRGRLSLSGR